MRPSISDKALLLTTAVFTFLVQDATAQVTPIDISKIEIGFTPRAIARIGDDLFVLTQPLVFTFGSYDISITVPSGFITDLASIPKALHWWEGKVDRSLAPAILHDYLYWYQPCLSAEADSVMMVGMSAMEMSAAKRIPIYAGVSIAGQRFYDQNTELRKGGQVRTFTPDYLDKVLSRPMNPSETLETALHKAKSNSGLVSNEGPLSTDGGVCRAVHAACPDCKK